MKGKRYDHICYLNDGAVHFSGGWHADIVQKLKTEKYNTTSRNWEEVNMNGELPDIFRSATVGVSESRLAFMGGVSCQAGSGITNGRTCAKTKDVYVLEPGSGNWTKTSETIETPRSSHVGLIIPTTIDFDIPCKPTTP